MWGVIGMAECKLGIMWKETAVVICCWNYCGNKQLWSSIAGITVQRSDVGHLLLELLWSSIAGITGQRSDVGYLLLELLWK
jgi:hypothetical protein